MIRRFCLPLTVALCTVSSTCLAGIANYDLTLAGAMLTGDSAIGGVGSFVAQQTSVGPTGTGFIDSFLRVQARGDEHGYNTSLGTPLDAKPPSGVFTRELFLYEIPIVTFNGIDYRQFLLDINESLGHEEELLSLTQLQVFLTTSDQLHDGVSFGTSGQSLISFGPDATEIFRLNDFVGDQRTILLDASLASGSGSGDMLLYLRDDLFVGAADQNVILYSQFSGSSSGFEEWAVIGGGPAEAPPESPAVPLPAPLLIWSLGTLPILAAAHRSKKAPSKSL